MKYVLEIDLDENRNSCMARPKKTVSGDMRRYPQMLNKGSISRKVETIGIRGEL